MGPGFKETKITFLFFASLHLAPLFRQFCEGSSQWIKCPSGEFINILHAMYGRRQNRSCAKIKEYPSDVYCVASKSFEIVSNKCIGKESCEVEAKNSWFDDPCPGVEKYLDIEYECLSSKCKALIKRYNITNICTFASSGKCIII